MSIGIGIGIGIEAENREEITGDPGSQPRRKGDERQGRLSGARTDWNDGQGQERSKAELRTPGEPDKRESERPGTARTARASEGR
jgi:hypothetical protein